MTHERTPGGTFTTSEGITFTREGFGAMQLAGPRVWGPRPTGTRRSACCARPSRPG